ncbi:hypothetical protein O9992_02145 [Vibrio lentus]|nr:hypothetical protein [Vibrio lentus]
MLEAASGPVLEMRHWGSRYCPLSYWQNQKVQPGADIPFANDSSRLKAKLKFTQSVRAMLYDNEINAVTISTLGCN